MDFESHSRVILRKAMFEDDNKPLKSGPVLSFMSSCALHKPKKCEKPAFHWPA